MIFYLISVKRINNSFFLIPSFSMSTRFSSLPLFFVFCLLLLLPNCIPPLPTTHHPANQIKICFSSVSPCLSMLDSKISCHIKLRTINAFIAVFPNLFSFYFFLVCLFLNIIFDINTSFPLKKKRSEKRVIGKR